MAPDDVLNSVEDDRRDFIRTVIAGTAFAVPLLASFSMEGLSLEPAEAVTSNLCSNQAPDPICCRLAGQIAAIISEVICITGFLLTQSNAVASAKAQLFKPLAKALQLMSDGILRPTRFGEPTSSDCLSSNSLRRFGFARDEIVSYLDLLAALCGPKSFLAVKLAEGREDFLAAIDALLAGQCGNGFGALQSLNTLRAELYSRVCV